MPFRFRPSVPRGLWPRSAADLPTEPKELLWWRVSALFTDPDETFYAGPSVEIAPLSPSTSVQAWDRLVSLAVPEDADETTWHEELDREVRLEDIPRAAAAALGEGRIGTFRAQLNGLRFNDVALPSIGLWVDDECLEIWWWIGPEYGWTPESVAALAELLEELRQLAPEARLEPSGATFPAAVDEYLRAKDSQARQPMAR